MLSLLASLLLSAQLEESITVTRVLVDVRVVSQAGEWTPDLTPEEFEVRIGGKRMIVEDAEWVSTGMSRQSPERMHLMSEDGKIFEVVRPPGRLMVVLVQTDFARQSWRLEGQMKFLQHLDSLIAPLRPEDRMAVFSFDSRLKFRLDFSADKEEMKAAIERSIFIDDPPVPPVVPYPSLAGNLDDRAMRRAASTEVAMTIIGNALRPIPGPKSLILLGHGLGRLVAGGVTNSRAWPAARDALTASRVSVMALDTTYADEHDLAVPMMTAAEETGGFYAQTHKFPHSAISELHSMISGHYELSLRTTEELKPGARTLAVRVNRAGMRAVAQQKVFINP